MAAEDRNTVYSIFFKFLPAKKLGQKAKDYFDLFWTLFGFASTGNGKVNLVLSFVSTRYELLTSIIDAFRLNPTIYCRRLGNDSIIFD